MFKAIWLSQTENDTTEAELRELDETQLPPNDVQVRIDYSTLNYKDALAITGRVPVIRQYPLIPGIDLAGIVSASSHPRWQIGDRVLLNGWGMGEQFFGGYAQQASVQGEHVQAVPQSLTNRQAMAIGTAGYTAMLAVLALERQHVTPDSGEIVVTGASGGLGSLAIVLLAKLGYTVVAATGRMEYAPELRALGAAEVINRAQFSGPGKPLAKERWAAAIDSAGGHTLANVCASTRRGGSVVACGMAQSLNFPATVAPFILRGVSLLGIDSAFAPKALRATAWTRLASDLDLSKLAKLTQEIGLSEVLSYAPAMLDGHIHGRVVVDVNR